MKTSPDELLRRVQEEEARESRGRLRLFFGMCAGTGKTYAMLQAAHQAVQEGVDVVVGYAETHGRIETERLLEGLEQIPCKRSHYKGVTLQEPDLDALLERRPRVVLIDELAHTNAPGSRHLKRYQDVQELLEQGIDVYTTLNVQHLESRVDTVAEITGIRVHETVPDSLLQNAQIDLVDLTPDALLKRLHEGKVYLPEKAKTAVQHFFRVGNLHALREIALRFTAEQVDVDMIEYMRAKNIEHTWKTTEKLMVAVGPSPYAQKLIRWTRRMAFNLGAQWIAVSIDVGDTLSNAAQSELARNQELARSLGARVVQVVDNDVVSGLLRVAVQNNVTQIVVGKTNEFFLSRLLNGGSIVDRLLKQSGNIDIYVVKADKTLKASPGHVRFASPRSLGNEFAMAVVVTGIVALGSYWVKEFVGYQTVGMFFMITLSVLSLFIGRAALFFSALLSALVWNFFFIPPLFTFQIKSFHDIVGLFVYLTMATTASMLISRLRRSQVVMQKSQSNISALLSILESLNNTTSLKEVARTTRDELKKHFNADAVLYLRSKEKTRLDPKAFGNASFHGDKEFAVATWCFDNRRSAGRFTATLPDSRLQYLPLISKQEVLGVLGIDFPADQLLSEEQMVLLRSFVSQITASVQREIHADEAKARQIAEESQRLFQTVLNSVSHELRTPIAVISAAVSNLSDECAATHPTVRQQIGEELNVAAMRLSILVEHIIDMSKIESGHLSLNLQYYEVNDLVGTVLDQLEKENLHPHVEIHLSPDLPMVKIDIAWLGQALINILHNAVNYTPAGTKIELSAAPVSDTAVEIVLRDHGPGVPPSALKNLFDKFYRVPGTRSGGTGLGLTITRAIVEAHNGTITANNRPDGGLEFRITLEAPTDVESV